jgi:predicted RNA binding protein YcfA (HicA-like mRNA interferase family)
MSKLQLVDAKTMEKLLLKEGFQKKRQKGSHAFYRHADGRTTTVPFHSSEDIARPLLRQIINEIKITVDEYNELLQK